MIPSCVATKNSFDMPILKTAVTVLFSIVLFTMPLSQVHAKSPVASSSATKQEQILILAFGDSLIAGFGLEQERGFTRQLEIALADLGKVVKVHNAGVTGDTTQGARTRLSWVLASLPRKPDLVIVELGANDFLRGTSPVHARKNLDSILQILTDQQHLVLLAGMKPPRSLGKAYVDAFDAIYPDLAKKYDIPLDPHFLEGLIGKPELLQRDGMHPNAQGARYIARRLAPVIVSLLP